MKSSEFWSLSAVYGCKNIISKLFPKFSHLYESTSLFINSTYLHNHSLFGSLHKTIQQHKLNILGIRQFMNPLFSPRKLFCSNIYADHEQTNFNFKLELFFTVNEI